MPKRQSVRKYETEQVQGEGSWVRVSQVKMHELRELRARAAEDNGGDSAFERGLDMLAKHVVSWNWVDDEGKPLPIPKDNPNVIDELTDEEATLLTELLTPKTKN